jgi:hypothetical protein
MFRRRISTFCQDALRHPATAAVPSGPGSRPPRAGATASPAAAAGVSAMECAALCSGAYSTVRIRENQYAAIRDLDGEESRIDRADIAKELGHVHW